MSVTQAVPLPIRERYGHLVTGEDVAPASADYFPTFDPSDGRVITHVARGDAADVDAAVRSCAETFASRAWTSVSPLERSRMLLRLAGLVLEHREELALLETLDNGKPLSQSRGSIDLSARFFEYYAGLADKHEGTQIPLDENHFSFTVNEPYGVVALILPWNGPLNQAARALAPALAVGNAAVVKPAEETPLSALRLGELVIEAGFPPGLVNVVTGYGAEAGQALVDHPGVRMISFTGSVETGAHVAKAAADRIVPVMLELGGKSAAVVFADADLDEVVDGMRQTFTKNAGQVCSAATRVVAHSSVIDELLRRSVESMGRIRVGRGVDDPDLGPLISQAQLDRVLGYVELGQQEGARLCAGGDRFGRDDLRAGYFMQPTIFHHTDPHARIAQDEIFGPVVVMLPFEDEDEAVAIANSTNFGLAAGVYSRDIGRAMRMTRHLQAGSVFVNEYLSSRVETPFGGYKQSGWGREKGMAALKHYAQTKTVVVRTSD